MSIISNMNFTYQEYKAYQQTHKDCGIGGRAPYSMIADNPETDDKKILANTFITEPSSNTKYEMTAEYTDDFSEDTPLIKVTINNAGNKQDYFVNIDEVNPRNASEVEVFALFSYADVHEKNMGFSSSIWNTLTGYVKNNTSYTGMNHVESLEKSYEQKSDWIAMVGETRDEYMSSGLYKQVSDGNKLISLFEHYGMPETVEMDYMDAEHWIPASNYVCQLFTDKESAFIEIDGNGSINYIDFQDESSNWSMKITQEQLAKALELKSLESAEGFTEFSLYISDKSFWESYLNSDISIDELQDIWQKAGEEVGIDTLDIDDERKLLYLSEFARKYLLAYLQNESEDFFENITDWLAQRVVDPA